MSDTLTPTHSDGRARIQSQLIALGELFFRNRSWTPIPFMVLLVVCSFRESPAIVSWVPGLILLALGEGLRLWAVAVVGKESRTRGSGVARLVASGPYRYVRNPLYLGNFLLTLGAACISRLLWMVPIVVVLYLIQYVPVILWEEATLAQRFGDSYDAYCQQVPRWVPRWPHRAAPVAPVVYQWRASFWSERSTLGTLALLLLLMAAKEYLHHRPNNFRQHPIAGTLQ